MAGQVRICHDCHQAPSLCLQPPTVNDSCFTGIDPKMTPAVDKRAVGSYREWLVVYGGLHMLRHAGVDDSRRKIPPGTQPAANERVGYSARCSPCEPAPARSFASISTDSEYSSCDAVTAKEPLLCSYCRLKPVLQTIDIKGLKLCSESCARASRQLLRVVSCPAVIP